MLLGLPSHVHLCVSGSMAVFLDIQHDRYRAVRLTQTLEAMLAGKAEARLDDPLCARLAAERLLAPVSAGARPVRSEDIRIARSSLLETGHGRGRISVGAAATIGWALLAEDLALKRGLSRRLEGLVSRATDPDPDQDPEPILTLAQAFADHRALLPWRRICLRDSLALLRLLQARELHADLIFAVQTEPFYAHCWVQSGPWILNDSAYFPSILDPILRIRA